MWCRVGVVRGREWRGVGSTVGGGWGGMTACRHAKRVKRLTGDGKGRRTMLSRPASNVETISKSMSVARIPPSVSFAITNPSPLTTRRVCVRREKPVPFHGTHDVWETPQTFPKFSDCYAVCYAVCRAGRGTKSVTGRYCAPNAHPSLSPVAGPLKTHVLLILGKRVRLDPNLCRNQNTRV